jgi:hypothetical protein
MGAQRLFRSAMLSLSEQFSSKAVTRHVESRYPRIFRHQRAE